MKKMILSLLFSLFIIPQVFAQTGSDHFAYDECIYLRTNNIVKQNACSMLNDRITKGEYVKILLFVGQYTEDNTAPVVATDIQDDFYRSAIHTAYKLGILQGEAGVRSRSGAGDSMNRAVAVTLGGRLYSEVDRFASDGSLVDLKDGLWFSTYARKAVSAGVIVGRFADGKRYFAAEDMLTYGEAIVLAFQFERARLTTADYQTKGIDGLPPRDTILGKDSFELYRAMYIDQSDVKVSENITPQPVESGGRGEVLEQGLVLNSIPFESSNVPQGANNVLYGKFKVISNETIQEVVVVREGSGIETDFDSVYLYFADDIGVSTYPLRVTSGKSIDSSTQEVRFNVNLKVSGTGILEVRAVVSLSASAASQHFFRIKAIKTDKKLYQFNPGDPNSSGPRSSISGSKVGTVIMRNNASLSDVFPGTRRTITRFELQVNSVEAGWLNGLTLRISGVSPSDMENYSLLVTSPSQTIALTPHAKSDQNLVAFQICENLLVSECEPLPFAKGETKVFLVQADLTRVRLRERIQIDLEETIDLDMVGQSTGYGVQVDADNFQTRIN